LVYWLQQASLFMQLRNLLKPYLQGLAKHPSIGFPFRHKVYSCNN
jgi:hypothetical protein